MPPWEQPSSPEASQLSSHSKARRLPSLPGAQQSPSAVNASGEYSLSCSRAGYEAPTQFAEETRNASRNIPWAIFLSVVATSLCGGLHIASLLFSVQVRSPCSPSAILQTVQSAAQS